METRQLLQNLITDRLMQLNHVSRQLTEFRASKALPDTYTVKMALRHLSNLEMTSTAIRHEIDAVQLVVKMLYPDEPALPEAMMAAAQLAVDRAS